MRDYSMRDAALMQIVGTKDVGEAYRPVLINRSPDGGPFDRHRAQL